MPSGDKNRLASQQATPSIPTVDLHAFLHGTPEQQAAIAKHVDSICRNTGFLIISNHGVDERLVDLAWLSARAFFELPLKKKLESKPVDAACPRGYFPLAAEALAKSLGVETPPDIKESFGIGPLRTPPCKIASADLEFHYGENHWPRSPSDFRDSMTDYFIAMTALGDQVLRLFAAALTLPQDYFEQFHTHPMSALRCISYPLDTRPTLPKQKAAGEHSDYGSISILKSDPDVAGLEIRMPSGQWSKAPLVRNAFIVNIGDMMARWTNDRWISTVHRVKTPGAVDGPSRRRQSLAFFHNTNFDAEIQCIPTCVGPRQEPRYSPVRAGRYLQERFSSAIN